MQSQKKKNVCPGNSLLPLLIKKYSMCNHRRSKEEKNVSVVHLKDNIYIKYI